jgi:hypothetical protein
MSTQNRPSFEHPRSVATTAWQASSRYGDGLCPWAVWSDLANSGSSVAPSFSTSTGHQNHQMALACITLSPMACIRSCSAAMTALDSSSFRFLASIADSPQGWGAAWSGATRRRTSSTEGPPSAYGLPASQKNDDAQRVRLANVTALRPWPLCLSWVEADACYSGGANANGLASGFLRSVRSPRGSHSDIRFSSQVVFLFLLSLFTY